MHQTVNSAYLGWGDIGVLLFSLYSPVVLLTCIVFVIIIFLFQFLNMYMHLFFKGHSGDSFLCPCGLFLHKTPAPLTAPAMQAPYKPHSQQVLSCISLAPYLSSPQTLSSWTTAHTKHIPFKLLSQNKWLSSPLTALLARLPPINHSFLKVPV